MHRIKLPGKEKNKKFILIILIIVAILVLVYEGNTNIKHKKFENINENVQEQEEIINSEDAQENITAEKKEINSDQETSTKESNLYNEAYKLFFSKEYKSSISKANELLNEFPNSYTGYNIRGIAKAYSGDYSGGMKDIDKSLEINDNYGYAKFNKALTYELYNKMDEALEWYSKALEDEKYVWSYYGIASIYGRRGNVQNAIKYLHEAINLDESVKEIAKTEHDFNPIRDSKEFQEIVNN